MELATMPSFEEGWIDNYVKLVPLHRGAASRTADETPPVISEDQATVSAAAGLTLRVSGLESASRGVVSVSRDDSLARAQSLMLHGDFSQLPVLAGTRELQGAVSWESIAQARMHRKDACMRDCIVPADVVGINDDLLAHIPRIIDNGYVFVRQEDRAISGIVTTADLSLAFQALAGPFLLLGEVERRLRRIVAKAFDLAELQSVRDPSDGGREVRSADDLTVGEYVRLFESKERWEKLNWEVDRKVFVEALKALRDLRNDIMHFSPDPIEPERLRIVRNLAKWLSLLQA